MPPRPSSLLRAVLSVSFLFVSGSVFAQQPAVQPRIRQAVDDASLTVLRGNTHPLALARYDRGMAPPSMPLERMLLVLKRSPEQDAALLRMLDEQQDKSSPNYHKWLTPEQFGKQFGPADADIQAVTSWLQTHGFQVAQVSKGRTVVEFSGTAAMVQEAFHTTIHKYVVGAEPHWANASDPQIPEALTPVVSGVWTLHNFRKNPTLVISDEHFPLVASSSSSRPLATTSKGTHFLSPGDFAVIYGINPAYQAGIDGTGATIAVVGRSNFNFGDVNDFRNVLGLRAANLSLYLNGPDPGDLGGGEEAEAVLDATWSGSVAPGANVLFVLSASTDTTDGVDLSELYIVDNNLADVMTESFGGCEAAVSSTELAGISALAEQAAAQGIAYVVSSGDTGSAGCDNLSETTASGPVSVNALASPPFVTAVGGTIFNENGQASSYWSSSTTVPVTALKYIPENVWNESCTSATCGKSANIAAAGGGPSSSVAKPNWQSGSNLHIPNDGFRDIPDVSLTAALHDPYLICLAGSCSQQGFLVGIGGTSASAPSFAGILALLNQKIRQVNQNSSERIGLANYALYRLANAETLSQCNASGTSTPPAGTCVFNDVTIGNNAVPGETSYGSSSPQFAATVGYDLGTGLGSMQVNNLLNAWAAVTYNSTSTTLTLTPTPTAITHGGSVQVSVAVNPSSGSVKPTGDVSLFAAPGSPLGQGLAAFPLTNGTATGVTHVLPGGTYNVYVHYAGDATFAPSDSSPVQVSVGTEPSSTKVSILTADANGRLVAFTAGPYGSAVYLRADVVGNSGFGSATGQVSFFDNSSFLTFQNLNIQGNTETPKGITGFAPGSHSITATYMGDISFATNGPSPAANFTITKAATITSVQSGAATVGTGSPVTLTATIDTTSGGLAPGGTVTFFSGSTQLPGSASLSPTFTSPTGFAQATATYQATSLPSGPNSITAQYAGDNNYTSSTSAAITVTVAPDFTLAFSGTSGNLMTISSPGSSGTLTLSMTGQNGYTGTVNFFATACSGLPLGAACSFNPPSVTGSGSTTLKVTTMAPHAMTPIGTMARIGMVTAEGLALAGIFVAGAAPRKRLWTSLLGLLVFAWMLTIVGCGGGSSSGGSSTPGTPVGSYQVTVSGNDGTFSHPVTFTLSIQ
jgi:hypothetical protein